jgi:hypothetical protein
MAKEPDFHKEVDKLISHISELDKLNNDLEKKDHNKPTEYKGSLHDILWNHLYQKYQLEKELAKRPFMGITCREEITEYTKTYLDSKAIHTPYLTNNILIQVIDTELIPLEYEVTGITYPGLAEVDGRYKFGPTYPINYCNLLPFPWNKVISWGLSFLFLIIGLIAIRHFISTGSNWIAWITGIYLAWHYFIKLLNTIIQSKSKSKIAKLAANFRIIRDEIDSNSYDSETMIERIKNLESNGLYVSSLIYPLLKITMK